MSLGAGVCVCMCVCVCQSAGKPALDRTGRCVCGAVCSENETGQNGEWVWVLVGYSSQYIAAW